MGYSLQHVYLLGEQLRVLNATCPFKPLDRNIFDELSRLLRAKTDGRKSALSELLLYLPALWETHRQRL